MAIHEAIEAEGGRPVEFDVKSIKAVKVLTAAEDNPELFAALKGSYEGTKQEAGSPSSFSEAIQLQAFPNGAKMHGLQLKGQQVGIAFVGADLFKLQGGGVVAPGARFIRCSLTEAFLKGAFLNGGVLASSELSDADFTSAILDQAQLFGSRCNRAKFNSAVLTNVEAGPKTVRDTTFPALQAEEAQFVGADARCAQFNETTFVRCSFSRANLEGASFYNARLGQSDFSGADLREVDFRGADLRGCKFKSAKLEGAIFDDKTQFPENFGRDEFESESALHVDTMVHFKGQYTYADEHMSRFP